MKPYAVLLQAALVVAGILVYDLVRDGTREAGTPTHEGRAWESPDPQQDAEGSTLLRGSAFHGLEQRMEALEGRQEALERSFARRGQVAGDPGAPAPSEAGTGPDVTDVRVTARDLEWFRAVQRQADEERRRETAVTGLSRRLARAGVGLSEAQRREIVDATIAYQEKVGEAMRVSASRQEGREARQSVLDALRAEYQRTINRLVPSTDAVRIMAALGIHPGHGLREDAPHAVPSPDNAVDIPGPR